MTGLVPPVAWLHTAVSAPLLYVQAAVAPLSAANSHVCCRLRQTARAVKSILPDGVETLCSSPPECGATPEMADTETKRMSLSLPPCAKTPGAMNTGEVEPKSRSPLLSA